MSLERTEDSRGPPRCALLAMAAGGLLIARWAAWDASAATLPGSSDAGRVDLEHKQIIPEEPPPPAALPEVVFPGAGYPGCLPAAY